MKSARCERDARDQATASGRFFIRIEPTSRRARAVGRSGPRLDRRRGSRQTALVTMRNTTTTIAETPTSKNNPRKAAVTVPPPYVFERLHPRTSVNPVATRIDRESPGQESLAGSVPIGSTQRCDANHLHISTARPLVVLVHAGPAARRRATARCARSNRRRCTYPSSASRPRARTGTTRSRRGTSTS